MSDGRSWDGVRGLLRALALRAVLRLHGLFVRWGLLDHPYGREYARTHYTVTGRRRDPDAAAGEDPTAAAMEAGADE